MPSLLQAAFVTASPYGWMVKRWRRYGDVFSSRFPIFGTVVYVADPALVKEVFTGDSATFHAGEANTLALGDALGEHSLLTLDEQPHLSQRKLLLPPFHGESVRRYVEVMAEATEREVARWPAGKEIELRPREFALLEYLLRNAGRVVSKTMILSHVWEYNFDPQTNIVDVLVSRLREKIDRPFEKKLLQTVRGVGYVLRAGE